MELTFFPAGHLAILAPGISPHQGYNLWRPLHVLQIVLAMLTVPSMVLECVFSFRVLFIALTGSTLFSYILKERGRNGCDQVRMLSLLSYSLCFFLKGDSAKFYSITFTGVQILIAYFTSGFVKILSPHWRKGDLLGKILNTHFYGIPKIAAWLNKHPGIQKLASFGAIAGMMAVPVTFFTPFTGLFYASVVFMFIFHIMTSLLMGLNDFMVTFPLGYPGLIILHEYLFQVVKF